MFVLTIDQRDSRHHSDRVPALLGSLNTAENHRLLLPFERTAGDEVQALCDDAETVLSVAEQVIRLGDWYLGIGIGAVEYPLPESSRHGRGSAYVAAREAVELAKKTDPPLAIISDYQESSRAQEAGALLRLLATIWQRRSAQGWEAVELMRSGKYRRQHEAAEALGISAQAMSRRLRVAFWELEQDVLPLLKRLFEESNQPEQ